MEDQDDWEDTTTEDCSGGPSTGCYQPTTMPTNKPIEEISNDGYYNDPGALNGSDTGPKTLTNDNVTINGETDFTYNDQDTKGDTPTPTPTPEPGTNVSMNDLSLTLEVLMIAG